MRLAFVHGINNEGNTRETIKEEWWNAILAGWQAAGLAPKPKPPICVGYYADLFATNPTSKAIAMGGEVQATGETAAFLQEYADAAGITQAELEAAADELGLERDPIAQGGVHERWVIVFTAALERVLPTKGKWMASLFLKQAISYINDKALATAIDKRVADSILGSQADPVIVIAHSLGTVVSYRVLADAKYSKRNVPLFVTLGSPLSLRMFRTMLPPRGSIPKPPIGAWLNARHGNDFVTLGRGITKSAIGFDGVVDETAIVNDVDDKHSITHYLSSPSVAREIHKLL